MPQAEWIWQTPRVGYLAFSEATDRPNLGYVCGKRQAIMIDAGNSPRHVREYRQTLQKLAAMPPAYAAITHWHWDHTFGMCAVHAKTVASQETAVVLDRVRRWAWTPEAMAARLESGEDIPFCDERIRLEYPDLSEIRVKRPDLTIAGEKVLDLGGLHCRLIPMDTPHSRDGLLVLVPEEGVLFGGDADGEDFYDGGGTYDKRRLERFIAWLEEMDFAWYIPGHWYACTKAEELDMLKQRYAAL